MSTFKAKRNAARRGTVSTAKLLATSALTAAGILAFAMNPAFADDIVVPDASIPETPSIDTPPAADPAPWSEFDTETGAIVIETPSDTETNITQLTPIYSGISDVLDIPEGYHVNIDQASSTYIFAAKAAPDADPTYILGRLTADGRVIIIDRNGVFFGADSVIDVAGIITTTGDLTMDQLENKQFGDYEITNITEGRIDLNGTVTVSGAGLAAFVAPTVTNSGVINATMGKVALASGEAVTLDLYGDKLVEVTVEGSVADALVENSGTINAQGGVVQISAAQAKDVVDNIINVSGIVDVSSVTTDGGKIVLSGGSKGKVQVSGILDATGVNGGDIDVTGKNILIEEAAKLTADGGAGSDGNGNGGDVYVFADNAAIFRGRISARGGEEGGNGGNAEVSGKNYVGFEGSANLLAPRGLNGTLLIDPTDIVIVAGNGAQDAQIIDQIFTEATLATTTIGWNKIVAQLALGNFTITTAGSGSQSDPDITIQAGRTYNSTNSLTLLAHDNIDILANADVINTGTGNITLFAGWDQASGTATPGFNGGAYTANNIDFGSGSSVITGGTLNLIAEDSVLLGTNTVARGANVNVTANELNLDTSSGVVTLAGDNGSGTLGTVTIERVTDGTISLGSGAAAASTTNMQITQAELNRIFGQNLVVGKNTNPNKETAINVNGANTQATITGAVTLNAQSNAVVGVANANSNNVTFSGTNSFNGLTVNSNDNIIINAGASVTSNGAVVLNADTNNEGVGLLQINNGSSLVTSDDDITFNGNEVALNGNGFINAAGGNITLNNKSIFQGGADSLRTSGDGTISLTVWDGNIGATFGSIQNAISALNNTGTGQNTLTLKRHVGSAGGGVTAGDGTFDENLTINQANLKIDGFDDNGGVPDIRILGNNGGASINVQAANFNLDPVIVDGGGVATYGVSASGPAASGLVVDGNTFRNFTQAGVFVDGAINGDVDIKNNLFEGTSQRGVQVGALSGATTRVFIDNNDMGTVGGQVINGVLGTGTVNGVQNLVVQRNTIRSTGNAVDFQGAVTNVLDLQVNVNDIIATAGHGVRFGGNISNSLVIVNSNDQIDAQLDGVRFDGTIAGGNTQVQRNTIVADDSGIRYENAINGGAALHIHDNVIRANDDGGIIGSGIFFNGTIDNATILIGIGNNSNIPAWDGSNIINVLTNFDAGTPGPDDGLDGIHFDKNVNNSNVTIDGNRIGYTGLPGVGPVVQTQITDDGIEFSGNVTGNTNVTISDNQISAFDNGILFNGNVGGSGVTSIVIGGQDAAEHGNTITAGTDGIRFNGLVTGEALIEASNNYVVANRDGIRFQGAVNNAKTTGGISEEEIHLFKNEFHGGQNGINFVSTVSGANNDVRIHDNRNVIGTAQNGITFSGSIDDADVQVYENGNNAGAISGGQNGVLFAGAIQNNANVEVRDNGRIQGQAVDGVRFDGAINGASVVSVNGNEQIIAFEDGVSFNGLINGNATINVNGNHSNNSNDGIVADDHGVYFAQNLADATINIDENNIRANVDGGEIGSGIFFDGTIQNATLNIGNGGNIFNETGINGNIIHVADNTFGSDDNLDGIHFNKAIGTGAVINIDANIIGGRGIPNSVALLDTVTDDGIEFRGAVNGNADVNITDNHILADDDGIRFNGAVGDTATITIGGPVNEANYIDGTAGHGIVFENTVSGQALVDISGNVRIEGGLDGIAFEGTTSNALLPAGASQQEINIANNTIVGNNNGIRFQQNVNTDLHDIRIAGNAIQGLTQHGVNFNGNIGGNESQIWIVDGNTILGDDDGIHVQGTVTNEANVRINDNTSIVGDDDDGIDFVGNISGGALVQINGNDNIEAGDNGIEFAAINGSTVEIIGNNHGIHANDHGIWVEGAVTNATLNIHDNIITANENGGVGDGIRFESFINGNSTVNIGDGDGANKNSGFSNVISGANDGIHFHDDVFNTATINIDGNRIGFDAATLAGPVTNDRLEDNGIVFFDHVYDASNVNITDNWIRVEGDGVRFGGNVYGTGKILIGGVNDGNNIDSDDGDGIQFAGTVSQQRLVEISYNTVVAADDGVRFTGQTSNALNPVTVQDEIWINENTITAGRHGIRVEQNVSQDRHDIRITGNWIDALNEDGIHFGGSIDDESQIWILNNDQINGDRKGIYVHGTISDDALFEVVGNTYIRGEDEDGIDFNGNIFGNAVVRINGNDHIQGNDNGIEFASVGGASTVEILGNNHGIHSNNHGIYFGGPVQNQADVDIHDNIINADDNNNGSGDGIHFAGNIQNQATVNIGDGNGSSFGNSPSNIISGFDGIHFAGDIQNQAQIVIDGNRLGFDGTTLAGPYFNNRLGDDGIQVEGELRNQASFIVTDNHIRAEGDGVSFLDDFENEAYVLIGGSGDGNTIDAEDDGVQFEGDILHSSLVEVSFNGIDADESGVRFDGSTSNADGVFPYREDEILIANNDIEADEYGIVFFGRASGERHDIMIRDNEQVHGHGEHGIAHLGGIDDAELRILDNDDIEGEIDGIHVSGFLFNGALIDIDGNTVEETVDGDGIEVTDTGFGGGVDVDITDNHIHFVGDNGIEVNNVPNVWIAFNEIHDTGNNGIDVEDSENAQIRWNNIYDTDEDGIYVEDSEDSNIENNWLTWIGDDGIDVRDSDGTEIEENFIWVTDGDGIQVRDSNGVSIDDNFIRFAGDDGIDFEDGAFSSITDNNIRFVDANGIEVEDSNNILIHSNTVQNADAAGIFVDPSAFIIVENNTLRFNDYGVRFIDVSSSWIIDNIIEENDIAGIRLNNSHLIGVWGNDITDNDLYGLWVDGGFNGYVHVVGNRFLGNPTHARFESGVIDLTGIDPVLGYGNTFIGGNIGLEFDVAFNQPWRLSLVRAGGGFTYDGNPFDTFDGVNVPGSPALNFGGTIGSQYFEGQTTSFVTLRSDTFVDPRGNAIWLDASDSTYFMPGEGLITGDVLTQAQFDFLESMFRHWPDANNRGIFWFGAVPASAGLENDNQFFEEFDPFNAGISGLNVTITGLPRLSGAPGTGPVGPEALNAIVTAAGDETDPSALASIEPAAGEGEGQNVTCWGDAVNAAGTSGPVNYSYGGTFEESIAAAASCGTQSF